MSDEIKEYLQPGKKNLILLYIMYLIGLVAPIFPVIGAAFAYANKSIANKTLKSHYLFALRTFYLSAAGWLVCYILNMIFINPIIYVVFVWYTVRSIIALQLLIQDLPHPNPMTFWLK